MPIIYADSSSLLIAAIRLKGQLAENSKMLSYHNELPELNHNEIVGWENNIDLISNLVVLWLKDISTLNNGIDFNAGGRLQYINNTIIFSSGSWNETSWGTYFLREIGLEINPHC